MRAPAARLQHLVECQPPARLEAVRGHIVLYTGSRYRFLLKEGFDLSRKIESYPER